MFGKIRWPSPRPAHAALQRHLGCCAAVEAAVGWGITTRNQRDTAMLDRPGPMPAEADRETTEGWISGLNAAVAGGQAAALSELFVADSHWRNLFGISWYFATFSGNATVVRE